MQLTTNMPVGGMDKLHKVIFSYYIQTRIVAHPWLETAICLSS